MRGSQAWPASNAEPKLDVRDVELDEQERAREERGSSVDPRWTGARRANHDGLNRRSRERQWGRQPGMRLDLAIEAYPFRQRAIVELERHIDAAAVLRDECLAGAFLRLAAFMRVLAATAARMHELDLPVAVGAVADYQEPRQPQDEDQQRRPNRNVGR